MEEELVDELEVEVEVEVEVLVLVDVEELLELLELVVDKSSPFWV